MTKRSRNWKKSIRRSYPSFLTRQEIKDEKYVHKNRLFDAKMELEKDYQAVKDRQHAAYTAQVSPDRYAPHVQVHLYGEQ